MKSISVQQFIDKIEEKRDVKEVHENGYQEIYYIICSILNEYIHSDWQQTDASIRSQNTKKVYYLSMEFLIGSLLKNNLLHYNLLSICNEALAELGFDPEKIYEVEHDPGLGNGGLGRLAACFLDSMASLNYPGIGCGIRYRYGLFEQKIINGYQTEYPDDWLKQSYPWEIRKEDEAMIIEYGGEAILVETDTGNLTCEYTGTEKVMAVPYDVPIVGFGNQFINTLRLWSAEPVNDRQNHDYYNQLEYEKNVEQISGYLYPDDSSISGKKLRLKQQYFLVSASLKKILDDYLLDKTATLKQLDKKVVIQINDTHPSLAIPELMRILMDEKQLKWDEAWGIVTNLFAYTNHTIMSEALETWPIDMVKEIVPRLYLIIEEINERFCQRIWFDYPELRNKIPELAVIAYDHVHMARLAIVASFRINGVAKLHTEILKTKEMKDFYKIFPQKFQNKTNGISHRRWLLMVNPRLANFISSVISPVWIEQPNELNQMIRYVNDKGLLEELAAIKLANKQELAHYIYKNTGVLVDDRSIFDVQIKRLHEYKRQLLNVFHIIYLYQRIKENPNLNLMPRTFIFAAKAAPSYHLAKEIIKLINTVADIVNHDPEIDNKIKVVFLENYNVSLAEKIIPAADVSEQISTASKEASGTGNMKMMMNSALTIGTLDGANIEIEQLVGKHNMFIFGLRSEQVYQHYQMGDYHVNEIYQTDPRIQSILRQLHDGINGQTTFKDIYFQLLQTNDPYFILKDFDSYVEAQNLIDLTYRDPIKWHSKCLVNIAHSGKFSSDRTIHEYASAIWNIKQLK
ncbi:glycogen/starch/alpha-glucan phosphorylase [Gracilibacillus oryzae]|uniref:Alpha-1,4 glucan phosphorylase n=1 Tax=Gracilibacillus oryzae TaxID=1672701 RepID=A0A7C8L029_9BACI|nr:glycogen/starch/alpha-glucan phosphorylase [Gracilibacillus oryzae]KAB8138536.1 glycogen/starch/alpha-glucan phosphorylase [Gracilibacillus oryzae]